MKKTVGILGFGIVGRSYADYFFDTKSSDISLVVWDRNVLKETDIQDFKLQGILFLDASCSTMREFVAHCDVVLVSPGVDVRNIKDQHKLIVELDIVAHCFLGKTVAITGTLGKTTVTALVAQMLSQIKKQTIPAAGNIGTPMLHALSDGATSMVLELSSFQLERSRVFAPDVAVMTNFFPNHLDRHVSMQEYFDAKWQLCSQQRLDQALVLPLSLFAGQWGDQVNKRLAGLGMHLFVTSAQEPHELRLDLIKRQCYSLFYLKKNMIMLASIINSTIESEQEIIVLDGLPDITFTENWLMAFASVYGSGISVASMRSIDFSAMPLLGNYHHRLEPIATINNVCFYNDSKATVTQATEAAAKKLAQQKKPLILILGGLGKGVDRSGLVNALKEISSIKKIYCFGAERDVFGLDDTFETLDQVLDDIFVTMQSGDQVLFSPSGSSFDLFNNYQHRGDVFKELVLKRAAQLSL